MFQTLEQDRTYLENKYHDTSKPFDPYNRMAYHGYEYDPATGMTDEQIREGLRTLCKTETAALPHPVAKAKAFAYILEHTRIDINEHDYFIGMYSWGRLASETTLRRWNGELFTRIVPDARAFMDKNIKAGVVDMWPDYDHSIPDWEAVLTLGFPGLLARAESYRAAREAKGALSDEQKAYFDAISIEYRAILAFLDRLHAYALTKTHAKAEAIAVCLAHLRDGAPQNTYEALQCIYLYFLLSECVDMFQVRSLGSGLDRSLLPFWQRDIANGTYTPQQLDEFLGYFLMQFSAIGNYWGHPLYLGGTRADGSTWVNEVSYHILDVYTALGIYNPKIQIKVNENTPKAFIRQVFDRIRHGQNSFVFVCEPGSAEAVSSYATPEEARNFEISGCYELRVRAGEVVTATIYFNALKCVNLVLDNGVDRLSGEAVGIAKGTQFDTFEDFLAAFFAQYEHILNGSMQAADRYEPYLDYVNPSPMFSATVTSSLERATDGYARGMKYNNTAVLHCGFASAVDALLAVKYLVYDKRLATLEELRAALAADWQGYDSLRHEARNHAPKYGNGDPQADALAKRVSDAFCALVNGRKNARGGIYKAIMHTAMEFVWMGKKTLATPDGRRAGAEMSKNASPAPGADRQGVTALIRSGTAVVPSSYPESYCLDVMLHPTAVQGEEGMTALMALLDVYMKNHGMSIQFNIVNAETLREAQKNPEKYKNLQIRVCGWNVLWSNLPRAEQDAYIERAQNIS
ncbi:MAG: pyruvate formate lyase family protein [Eubacteriales bacterium]